MKSLAFVLLFLISASQATTLQTFPTTLHSIVVMYADAAGDPHNKVLRTKFLDHFMISSTQLTYVETVTDTSDSLNVNAYLMALPTAYIKSQPYYLKRFFYAFDQGAFDDDTAGHSAAQQVIPVDYDVQATPVDDTYSFKVVYLKLVYDTYPSDIDIADGNTNLRDAISTALNYPSASITTFMSMSTDGTTAEKAVAIIVDSAYLAAYPAYKKTFTEAATAGTFNVFDSGSVTSSSVKAFTMTLPVPDATTGGSDPWATVLASYDFNDGMTYVQGDF